MQLRGGLHDATPEHTQSLKRMFLTIHAYCTADIRIDRQNRFKLPRERIRPPKRIPSAATHAYGDNLRSGDFVVDRLCPLLRVYIRSGS